MVSESYFECMDRLRANFWTKVSLGAEDECWEWKASYRTDGYGAIGYLDRSIIGSHRVAWWLTRGAFPEEMRLARLDVCHHCDNRKCCNPDHLFAGDRSSNMLDASAKHRLWNQNRKQHQTNFPKSHCHLGHEMTPENVRFSHSGGRKIRKCKQCAKEYQLLYRSRKK